MLTKPDIRKSRTDNLSYENVNQRTVLHIAQ